jgi:hypothetical protein
MPVPALALVGCMPCDFALRYLSTECVPTDPDPAALVAEWHSACGLIQGPPPNVGTPEILEIPDSHQGYVTQLRESAQWKQVFEEDPNLQVKMVEAAPILAYQFQVLDGPAGQHGGGLSSPPAIDELLSACLPMMPVAENFRWTSTPNSVLVETRALNLRPALVPVPTEPGTFTFRVGVALPFVHVVRFEGRCFLFNGYHRTYAALARGATHVPCVFRDVATLPEIGIGPGTFPPEAFQSENPPCMHKFATGQAHQVQLVVKTRTVQLVMTDWVTPEI